MAADVDPGRVFALSANVGVLPVVHGSGDFAFEVRRLLLTGAIDRLAVPLPPSFQEAVLSAVGRLPAVSVVVQRGLASYGGEWSPDDDSEDDEPDGPGVSYVPVDPCQPVIAAIRVAIQERIPVEFVEPETDRYVPFASVQPDAYALKSVRLDRFAAATVPANRAAPVGQRAVRIKTAAARLREFDAAGDRTLMLAAIDDWPWLRDAFLNSATAAAEDDPVEDVETFAIDGKTLIFLLGELPFVTGRYESARETLDPDEHLSVDGVKDLLLASRDAYKADFKNRSRKISPKLLVTYLQYVRNLSLVERRLTPDLYTLVVAARQIFGDTFARHLAETARDYPYADRATDLDVARMGINKIALPSPGLEEGEVFDAVSRLPGPPVTWRSTDLARAPDERDEREFRHRWNPFYQCSWPPEDEAVENLRTTVKDLALEIIGSEMARSEKFTTSLRDGLDIRETLRNRHTGDLYVKIVPPATGTLDCVVMLFDTPADPRDYKWRTTWQAEHQNESTIAFFATHFGEDLIGPGVARATYGGVMFLFPPRPLIDVWSDPALDVCDTLEERLVMAACRHAEQKHVAVLADAPPGRGFQTIARKYKKQLVHVPLGRLGQDQIERLRTFHVLNGREVRSYAAHFIRRP